MSKKKSDSSYFQIRLRNFLIQYHPHLIEDDFWVEERCNSAEDVYLNRVRSGSSPHAALEVAHQELFEGLEFSLYTLINDLLSENFEDEISTGDTKQLAFSVLPTCQELYDSYSFSDTENVEDSLLYPAFKLELLGTLSTYLEKHGIQQTTTSTK